MKTRVIMVHAAFKSETCCLKPEKGSADISWHYFW